MKTGRKKPIQIYIEPRQDRVLAALARNRNISKAELIRESLDKYLREIPLQEDPATGLIGLGDSGKQDLSQHHDDYLALYARQKNR
jgi:hypothetical protein